MQNINDILSYFLEPIFTNKVTSTSFHVSRNISLKREIDKKYSKLEKIENDSIDERNEMKMEESNQDDDDGIITFTMKSDDENEMQKDSQKEKEINEKKEFKRIVTPFQPSESNDQFKTNHSVKPVHSEKSLSSSKAIRSPQLLKDEKEKEKRVENERKKSSSSESGNHSLSLKISLKSKQSQSPQSIQSII